MKNYTAFEYLMIDLTESVGQGLDKKTFEQRIQWVRDNFKDLEKVQAENPVKYVKDVLTLRSAIKTGKTSKIVFLDATCSGIQIMSALAGCISGATHTGLINPNVRADLYTYMQTVMNDGLASTGLELNIPRSDLKEAVMTSGYGSTKVPRDLFEPLGVLEDFYAAFKKTAPGAYAIQQALLTTWNDDTTHHEWVLPDGFEVKAPVVASVEKRLEIDELGHSAVSVMLTEFSKKEKGRANVANAIHSVDALVLRNMHRRCNYNEANVRQALHFLQEAGTEYVAEDTDLDRLIDLAEINQWFDPIFLDRINASNVYSIPVYIRHKLIKLAEEMLVHPPFPLVTVHDAFGSHATNCNRVRYWYKEIMAELNESDILTSIWNQLGKSGSFKKQDIADKIRNSNYGLA